MLDSYTTNLALKCLIVRHALNNIINNDIMSLHSLKSIQKLPIDLDKAWDFFFTG